LASSGWSWLDDRGALGHLTPWSTLLVDLKLLEAPMMLEILGFNLDRGTMIIDVRACLGFLAAIDLDIMLC
jgi:hypothetical protein